MPASQNPPEKMMFQLNLRRRGISDQTVLRTMEEIPRDAFVAPGDRDEAYLLRNFLNARFGREGWQCEDQPAEPGETSVAGIFIKQRCVKEMDDGTHGLLVTRHLRKPGQSQYDPHSGKETVNQFESNVRFELVRTN